MNIKSIKKGGEFLPRLLYDLALLKSFTSLAPLSLNHLNTPNIQLQFYLHFGESHFTPPDI